MDVRERPKRRRMVGLRRPGTERPTGWGWLSGAWKAHYYDEYGTTLCRKYSEVKRVGYIWPAEEPQKLERWKCVKCLHALRAGVMRD